jgi:hypothetical protein
MKTVIDPQKGVYNLPVAPFSFEIPGLSNSDDRLIQINTNGIITSSVLIPNTIFTGSAATHPRYEYYKHSGSQVISGSTHVDFYVNGLDNHINGGLTSWNTGSSIFMPPELGGVYTLRLEGEVLPVGGNPIFHIDFLLSGSDLNLLDEDFRHKQTVELAVRNSGPHQHFHGIFVVFADADLYVSGGIFKALTSGPSITLTTTALMIKEG